MPRRHHVGIVDAGPDDRTGRRAHQSEPHAADHERGDRDKKQRVVRKAHDAERNAAVRHGRHVDARGVGAPDEHDGFLNDEHEPEREEDLIDVAVAREPAHRQRVDEHATQRDRNRRNDDSQPEVTAVSNDVERRVRAERVKRAVREARDIEHADDQRQTRRDQRVNHALHDAIEDRELDQR